MASNAPAQSPDQKQGEGNVNRKTEPQTTASSTRGIKRNPLWKKVHSKRPGVVFKTLGLHGSFQKPYFRRYKESMREMRYGRFAKGDIGYLMMPKKTSKSDEKEYHIEEQEQDPTEDMSEDGDDDHGSASHDPLYERK
ncbi:hypothetical protein PG996_010899 [Apiospora saccharicola]|uniref:Uncharacterized protein n=1 Tax=Apiospora saccharicola TaxID=335842 RepID=A0ABR1UPW5_9PEZI